MGDLDWICDVIAKIQAKFDMLNADWQNYLSNNAMTDYYKDGKMVFSLKTNTVLDLRENSVLLNLVIEYQNFVVDKFMFFDLYNVRTRIKTTNSIQSKIETYAQCKDEAGHVPIKKCLNDICGARIEIDDKYSFEEIIDYIKSHFSNSAIRVMDASKNGYRAIHIYFRNGNFFFPIELQIWYKKDHDANNIAHAEFKQTYVRWEDVASSNDIIKEEK